uniref:Uncharacterized protein n=1 Tax=Arundo donax TaxID=35708 RepID=A0A0A8ZWU0_ARUDO
MEFISTPYSRMETPFATKFLT